MDLQTSTAENKTLSGNRTVEQDSARYRRQMWRKFQTRHTTQIGDMNELFFLRSVVFLWLVLQYTKHDWIVGRYDEFIFMQDAYKQSQELAAKQEAARLQQGGRPPPIIPSYWCWFFQHPKNEQLTHPVLDEDAVYRMAELHPYECVLAVSTIRSLGSSPMFDPRDPDEVMSAALTDTPTLFSTLRAHLITQHGTALQIKLLGQLEEIARRTLAPDVSPSTKLDYFVDRAKCRLQQEHKFVTSVSNTPSPTYDALVSLIDLFSRHIQHSDLVEKL